MPAGGLFMLFFAWNFMCMFEIAGIEVYWHAVAEWH